MRILVTGADGFTGRHFIQAAQAQGHEIVRLKANLTDYSLVQEEVAQNSCDAVVHLAAISFVGAADESSFYRVNVVGTCNLLKALTTLTVTPKIILLASSANIYGNCDQSPISEEQVPAPLNHYAMSKLAMEHMARTYMDMLPIFFVRPFNYTGPGQGEIFILPKIAAHFAKRAPFIELGNIQVAREFNDVRFVCEAYLRLLNQADPGEIYNICSGKPVAISEIIELFMAMTQHDIEVRVNPSLVRRNDIQSLYGDPQKLIATVGEISMPTLTETIEWMLEKNYVTT